MSTLRDWNTNNWVGNITLGARRLKTIKHISMIKWFLIYFKYWNRIFFHWDVWLRHSRVPKSNSPIYCMYNFVLPLQDIHYLFDKNKYVRFPCHTFIPSILIRPNVNLEPLPYDMYIVPLNIFDVRCSQGYIENKKY